MRSLFDNAASIAALQHGRVTRSQLTAAGVDPSRIRRWLADGRLTRVHRGVFAVGHLASSVQADYIAAVLACGQGARLSHRAEAHLLEVVKAKRPPTPEVTVVATAGRRRPGITVHRVRSLHRLDTWTFDAIPVMSVPRLLLDLAASSSLEELILACHQARVRYRIRPEQVTACIERNPHRAGVGLLRRALKGDATLSPLERAFLDLLRHHGMPPPRTNIDLAGDKVDCHWPELGLTVELLSYRYHGSRHAFETDVARRRRSNHVAFSHGDVFERGSQTAVELERLLNDEGRPAGRPRARLR
ncbi:MAG: hypothetical protein QOI73_2056 [Solirubrobacteraceae bacterium]|nr:hypothetical protein [Solirubrobacteraceae bacterium]